MTVYTQSASVYRLPLLESKARFVTLAFVLFGFYLALAVATVRTRTPIGDEASFANASYNLLYNGFMGTTLFGENSIGPIPAESLRRHTYWTPPLYFLTNTALFKIFGFGIFQIRVGSIFWGLVALLAWWFLIRSGGNSAALSLAVVGFIAFEYFFQLSASFGRMEMMCLALGTAGLASYYALRATHLDLAVFVSNSLVAASGLTHAVGIMYFCGLVYLVISLDWKRFRWRQLAIAAVPYLVGAVGWGAYIMQDPAGFRDQWRGQLLQTTLSAGMPTGFAPLMRLKMELIHRYLEPFGLAPGVPLLNRTKALLLFAYLVGLLGILSIRRLRNDRLLRTLVVLAGIDFAVLTFVATSKQYYYLPHITAVLAACLGLFLLRLPAPGSRGQLLAVISLVGLAAVQAGGLIIRARENPFGNSYLPAIQAIRTHSEPGSVIFAPAHFWFYLQPERTVIMDWTLGYTSGVRGRLVVQDPLFREIWKEAEVGSPRQYKHIQEVIGHSQKVFDNGIYVIYDTSP